MDQHTESDGKWSITWGIKELGGSMWTRDHAGGQFNTREETEEAFSRQYLPPTTSSQA